MKIFVVEPRGTGGMIHYAYQLCNAMAEEGADVTLVTAREYELQNLPHKCTVNRFLNLWKLSDPRLATPPRNKLERLARKIFWNIRRGFRGIRLVVQWIRLTNYLLRARPDFVQFGEIEFPFEGLFLQYIKKRGLTLAQVCHEFESRESNSWAARLKDRLNTITYHSFEILFLHGESNRQRFLSFYPVKTKHLHLIVHGNEQVFPAPEDIQGKSVEMRQRYGLTPQQPVVLFFGTLTPSKGVSDLVDAFAQIHAADSQARLVIAGMPTKFMDMPNLIAQVDKMNLKDVIIFDSRYIPLEEIAPLFHLAQVVVLPYLNSTQSGVIQTAYTFGRPVVATNVGAFPEVIDDGQSGILVNPGAPGEIAAAVLKIIGDNNLGAAMGQYAKNLSETKFDWRPIARTVLDAYASYTR
jgi:glycosyltransferase involved in cell wall biosynthesis